MKPGDLVVIKDTFPFNWNSWVVSDAELALITSDGVFPDIMNSVYRTASEYRGQLCEVLGAVNPEHGVSNPKQICIYIFAFEAFTELRTCYLQPR